jgi:hypothetical protein
VSDDKDFDLLDMLNKDLKDVSSSDESAGDASSSDESFTVGNKTTLDKTSSIFDMVGTSGNLGCGDVTEDLMNWFSGKDSLPSDPLVEFLNSSSLKVEFGMMFNMIKNFSRLKKLQDFVDKAEEIYFNPDDLLTLEPDELKSRMSMASDVMKNMYEMNRKTILGMKKKVDEDEMDKLKILLSAIPSHKLKDIITNLNNT